MLSEIVFVDICSRICIYFQQTQFFNHHLIIKLFTYNNNIVWCFIATNKRLSGGWWIWSWLAFVCTEFRYSFSDIIENCCPLLFFMTFKYYGCCNFDSIVGVWWQMHCLMDFQKLYLVVGHVHVVRFVIFRRIRIWTELGCRVWYVMVTDYPNL